MLNKRIKSLFVAGLLIAGMSGNAFAAELPKGPFTSYQTYPTISDKSSEASFQDGAIVVDVSIDGNYANQDVYMYEVLWNPNKYDVTKITLILDDGYEIYTDLTSEHRSPTEDSTEVEGFKVYKGQGSYKKGKIVKEIRVEYDYSANVTDTDENGKPDFKDDNPTDPDTPNKPVKVDDPSTGDAGVAGLLLAAVGIGTGLVVVNKGKDDEEE